MDSVSSALRSLGVGSPSAVTKSPSGRDLHAIQQKLRPGHQLTLAQTLATLFYVWSFGLGIYCWLLALWACTRLPLLWPALLAYSAYVFSPRGGEAPRQGDWPAPLRRAALWRHLAAHFPARLHKTAELAGGRPLVFCFHPHGILSFSAWLAFATDALGFSALFPGVDCRLLTLRANFTAPFQRQWLLLHGACDVRKRTCLNLLRKGKAIAIAVGGGTESLYAKPGANELVLARRKGFIKVALRTGASLVPVYAFGENSTFRTANELPPSSRLRRLQRRLAQLAGFTVPLYFGRGLLLPWGFLPYPVPLDIVVGAPLAVPKFEGMNHRGEHSGEFEALVDEYHAKYVAALRRLFDEHKAKFAQGEADLELVE